MPRGDAQLHDTPDTTHKHCTFRNPFPRVNFVLMSCAVQPCAAPTTKPQNATPRLAKCPLVGDLCIQGGLDSQQAQKKNKGSGRNENSRPESITEDPASAEASKSKALKRTFSSCRRRRRALLSLLPLLFFPPQGLFPLRLQALLPSVLRG